MHPRTPPPTTLEQELQRQLHTLRDRMEPPPVETYLLTATTARRRSSMHRWVIPIAAAVLIAVVTGTVLLLAAPSTRQGATPQASRRPSSVASASFPQLGSVLQSRTGTPNGPTVPLGGTTNVIGRAGYERLQIMIWGGGNCRFEPKTVTITSPTTVTLRLSYVGQLACFDVLRAVTTLLSTPGVDATRPTTVTITFDPGPGIPARHYSAVLAPDH